MILPHFNVAIAEDLVALGNWSFSFCSLVCFVLQNINKKSKKQGNTQEEEVE